MTEIHGELIPFAIADAYRRRRAFTDRKGDCNDEWSTDVIDKSLFDKSALFSCRARTTAWRRAGSEV
ncbi:hypothetical protein, partial [Mesorhizobium sp. M0244]